MLMIDSVVLVGAGGVAYHSIIPLGKLITTDRLYIVDHDRIDKVHARQWPGAMAGMAKSHALGGLAGFAGVAPDRGIFPVVQRVEGVTEVFQPARPTLFLMLTDNKASRRYVWDVLRAVPAKTNRWIFMSAGNGAAGGWSAWWPMNREKYRDVWLTMMGDILGDEKGAPPEDKRGRAAPCGGEQTLLANVRTAELVCRSVATLGEYWGGKRDESPTMFFWAAKDAQRIKTWTEGPVI